MVCVLFTVFINTSKQQILDIDSEGHSNHDAEKGGDHREATSSILEPVSLGRSCHRITCGNNFSTIQSNK